jgi:ABC-2 type transport system permease protein
MRNIAAICQKELKQMFSGALAYVILAGFLMLTGFFFYDLFSRYTEILGYPDIYQQPGMMDQINVNALILTPLFQNMCIVLLMLIPLIAMQLYAKEKNAGTDQLLLTSPVSVSEIVTGKFLAGAAFYTLALALTLLFPAIVAKYASPDMGKIAAGYLGLYFVGLAFLAVGLFISTLTSSQAVAAVATNWALLVIYVILGWIAERLPGLTATVVRYLGMGDHFERFGEGLFDISDLVYFLGFIAFFWFLTTRSVESTRWR